MRRAIIAIAAIGLIASVAVAAYLTLQGCGLNATWLGRWLPGMCRPFAETAFDDLQREKQRNESLRLDIAQAERALARMQCEVVHAAPLPPARPPELPNISTPPVIDEEAWRAGDLGALNGCWDLDSDYRVEHIETHVITHYTQWRMCFDGTGHGTEEMTATNGTRCAGNVTGSFNGAGLLGIDEPGNLQCSDNTMIFRRVLSCALAGDGTASCTENQPELGRTSTVRLRRSNGE
ncbi:MAG: hypothetical protein KDE08_15500 [Rhodobacteraceae bacterium]|nr:hypothetical protein [Paracoccaceae bacterium]